MKIFLVTRSLSGVVGGVERQLGNIAYRLSQSGHDVSILSSDEEPPALFFAQLSRFPILTYGQGIDDYSPRNSQRAKRQRNFFRLIHMEKPDLIIGFMLSGFLAALPTAAICRTPLVLAERNSPDVYKITLSKKYSKLYFLLMRFSAVITVQLEEYKHGYPTFLQSKIKVIYNEILLRPREPLVQNDRTNFTFGFVGRFSYQKQPIMLLDSFARHISTGNSSHLIFFGKGELESEIRKRVSFLGIQDYVKLNEPIEDLEKIYTSIDALCLPSLWEGFPNVVGEAMMYGLPVLGNKECLGLSALVSRHTGLLINFEDPNIDGFSMLRALVERNEHIAVEIQTSIRKLQEFNFVELWNEVVSDATR